MLKFSIKQVLIFLSLFSIVFPAPIAFTNGVHIVNKDSKAHEIVYTEWTLTTKICSVKKPVKNIKNGLDSARMRTVKGFTILKEKSAEGSGASLQVTATIAPHTEVYCLVPGTTSIQLEDGNEIKNASNGYYIIEKNKIKRLTD